jgi:hypothetical protein
VTHEKMKRDMRGVTSAGIPVQELTQLVETALYRALGCSNPALCN